ncbi:MAG: hypothetical protein E7375_02635 [Clostridiales bacterium]|nr:hypothetical protein [Clostridiales bacterium]
MSTPIFPNHLALFKVLKEFESSSKTIFKEKELKSFCTEVLQKAQQIEGEEFFPVWHTDHSGSYLESLTRICDARLDENRELIFSLSPQRVLDNFSWLSTKRNQLRPSFVAIATEILNEKPKNEEKPFNL